MDRFDETLLLLGRELGWRSPYYTKQNVNPERSGLLQKSSEAIAIIREQNALDVALYKCVEQEFHQRIEALGASFSRRVRRFQTENRIWQWAVLIPKSWTKRYCDEG